VLDVASRLYLKLLLNGSFEHIIVLQEVYGKDANKWLVYWRLFYLACSELFKLHGGEEYGLAHYTFRKVS
jgi:hypothetical protein